MRPVVFDLVAGPRRCLACDCLVWLVDGIWLHRSGHASCDAWEAS